MTITFDDGYAENCDTALPLLVEEKIPCTYFVTTESVLTGQPFSHDTEMGNTFLPNTIEQLRRFADCGIEIGAHSRTHADIAQISDEHTLYDEVVTARDDLQDALGHPVRWFAFPFGAPANLSRAASRLAARHDFDGVVSAYGGYNFPGDDAFHLQRIGVDGPEVRLKNWAYWDPLKQLRLPKVDLSVLAEQVDTESEIAEVCGAS
jgi:peptidoglycan/xylan/chitin deacetylase (PgdA/CDA1 family)